MNSFFTKTEIEQQPELWKEVYSLIHSQSNQIKSFVNNILVSNSSEIIFTGAGSSFFIGEMTAGIFQKNTGITTKAISSTEILTHPELTINPNRQTLMISYARSGNSPESIAAIEVSNKITDNISHLIITCNKDGSLAQLSGDNIYVINLPEIANDKGLAMTSSVTSMALAGILISRLDEISSLKNQVYSAAKRVHNYFKQYNNLLKIVAAKPITRAVFLGSGQMLGMAREAHLKVQEMTSGKIICKFDSFLGFRHGPKVVIDETTLLVYFFSNDKYVQQYEKDLVLSIQEELKPLYTIGIAENKITGITNDLDIYFSDSHSKLNEEFLMLCSLIPIQQLSFLLSLSVGLNPDSPSNNGVIHRVVQGVKIYNYNNSNAINVTV